MIKKANILLVDDSEIIIHHLKTALGSIRNITPVQIAGTLSEAQKMMKTGKIDIVVLDIQLPDGNGMVFLKWLKHLYPQVRIIMLSNLADEWHRLAAKNAGVGHFLDKSEEFEEIAVIVSQLADKLLVASHKANNYAIHITPSISNFPPSLFLWHMNFNYN